MKYKGLGFCLLAAIVLCVSQICSAEGYGNQKQWGGVGGPDDHEHDHHEHDHDRHETDHSRETEYPNGNPGTGSQFGNDKYQHGVREKNAFSKRYHVEKFGYPIGCVKQENPKKACNYFVEISKDEDDQHNLHFELTARPQNVNQGAYVAVGLSKDKDMGEDHIVECIKLDDGRFAWYHSWSTNKVRPIRLEPDQTIISMESRYPRYEDNILQCKFKRPIETHVDTEGRLRKFDLIHDKFYVLLAIGKLNGGGGDVLGYHGDPRNGNVYAFPESLGNSTDQKYYKGRKNNVHRNQAAMNFVTLLIVLPTMYMISVTP